MKKLLLDYYNTLLQEIGPRHWWPAKTKFEVMVGAILTQNTAWKNVKKAIDNVKKAKALNPVAIMQMPNAELAKLIKPAGYYNLKTQRLKNLVEFFVKEYNGNVSKMSKDNIKLIREKLLSIKGVGKETADSIILYALNKPIFVVDAYTKRIFVRHGIIPTEWEYDKIQGFFMSNLPEDVYPFNEYHALIVYVGNNFCSKNAPKCNLCPLNKYLPKLG